MRRLTTDFLTWVLQTLTNNVNFRQSVEPLANFNRITVDARASRIFSRIRNELLSSGNHDESTQIR